MKAEIAFALLVVLISSVSLQSAHDHGHKRPDSDYPELHKYWTLKFDHASRNGVRQDSNSFAVEFNGQRIKEWHPTDYNIHSEKVELETRVGKNDIHFIGTGISDGLGHGVDNIKLARNSFCGWENVIVNGGFEEGHNVGRGWSIFGNGKIPGWKTTDNELEIGWGKIYNPRWPDTHIAELDGRRNTNAYQEFFLDEWNRIAD